MKNKEQEVQELRVNTRKYFLWPFEKISATKITETNLIINEKEYEIKKAKPLTVFILKYIPIILIILLFTDISTNASTQLAWSISSFFYIILYIFYKYFSTQTTIIAAAFLPITFVAILYFYPSVFFDHDLFFVAMNSLVFLTIIYLIHITYIDIRYQNFKKYLYVKEVKKYLIFEKDVKTIKNTSSSAFIIFLFIIFLINLAMSAVTVTSDLIKKDQNEKEKEYISTLNYTSNEYERLNYTARTNKVPITKYIHYSIENVERYKTFTIHKNTKFQKVKVDRNSKSLKNTSDKILTYKKQNSLKKKGFELLKDGKIERYIFLNEEIYKVF